MQPCKSRWIAVIFGLIFVTIPSLAKANDPGFCFMVTSSGKIMNLSELCKVTPPTATFFRIPIKRREAQTPIIDVKFNGNQIFEMVFDNSASGILITPQMAKFLKLTPREKIKFTIADGSIVELPTGIISSIGVGGLVINHPQVAVPPQAQIGLVSHDFFENYDITILDKYIEFHRR